MITIVDYGLGNIKAFANVYKRLNIPACYASTAEQLQVMTYLAEHDALPEILILGLDIARFNLQLNSIGETAHAIVPYYRMQADYYLSRLSKMPNQISQFEIVKTILSKRQSFGQGEPKNIKVNVEFW